MLVGILTTAVIGGAALIEKAKIQKVVEDINYYEKAFVNFTIQFGQMPGNLTLERCEENIDIFKKCKVAKINQFSIGDTIFLLSADRVVDYVTLTPFTFMQIEKAGFIKGKVIKSLEIGLEKLPSGISPTSGIEYRSGYDFLDWYGGKLDFDKTGRAIIDGSRSLKTDSDRTPMIRGSFHVDSYKGGARDNRYINTIALLFIRNQPKSLDKTQGIGKGASGLLSANLMEKVDKKIDDGFPKKGKIQGMKIGNGIDETDNTVVCYNALWDQKDSATKKISYVKDKNAKRGCNLIYYLPDYSGYIY